MYWCMADRCFLFSHTDMTLLYCALCIIIILAWDTYRRDVATIVRFANPIVCSYAFDIVILGE